MEEWQRQRQIYLAPKKHSTLRVGFAAFYLNRCNRSGIIGNAGVIGGQKQTGKWKIDARFNREDLVARIQRVAQYRDRIKLTNLDAKELLEVELPQPSLVDRAFVYLDPPYYCKGSQLYLNHYKPEDHATLATFLASGQVRLGDVLRQHPRNPQTLQPRIGKSAFNLGYSAP